MRNLISILIKYHFFILFVIFEIFSLFLLVRNNDYQRKTFLQSSNVITGKIYKNYSAITEYLALKEENKRLAFENTFFRTKLISSYKNLSTSSKTINDTIYKQQYVFTSAKVINNSVNRQNNYLTLDKGSNNGIKPEMAVLSSNGVIGVVKNVSKNFSTVISLLNSNLKISVKLKKSNEVGSLAWDGWDYKRAKLNEIPFHVKLRPGDTIVTSGYSAMFPEGIFVGTVLKSNIPVGSNFYDITIKLSTNFNNISYVYIVTNLFKDEQKKLEKELEDDQTINK